MKKAIFIDKDGTLIKDVAYNTNPALIELNRNVLPGLALAQDSGYVLVVVSNQPGVAFGYFEETELLAVESSLNTIMEEQGLRLEIFLYCPHHPQGSIERYAKRCACRKPSPGMFHRAAKMFDINLASSWMIGDILDDIEAGKRAGCRTVLIDCGSETEWIMNSPERVPDYIVPTVNAGCQAIIQAASAGVSHVVG